MSSNVNVKKYWFYWSNSTVFGPFDEATIQAKLSQLGPNDIVQIWKFGLEGAQKFQDYNSKNYDEALRSIAKPTSPKSEKRFFTGPFLAREALDVVARVGAKEKKALGESALSLQWALVSSLEQSVGMYKAERRKHPRIKCPGTVTLFDGSLSWKAELQDISVEGLRCVLKTDDRSIFDKKKLQGEVEISEISGAIGFEATMMNQVGNSMGFKFHRLSSEDLSNLDQFIDQQLRALAQAVFTAS